ncbi:hypothetical protein GH714_034754 [Hevea brasiliensis]|uniref:Uncharacterized protein n=1 Tax=Hevea brasiliensis TaxID=3981 RepID=A0A6A6M2X6_HEVBR|nr:hypothetical protein GH714_034754 [Hevea brasiliensis]
MHMFTVERKFEMINKKKETVNTDLPGVGVGEMIHKKTNGPQTEALITTREYSLQLLVVNKPTAVLISESKARNDVGIRPWRKAEGTSEANGLPYGADRGVHRRAEKVPAHRLEDRLRKFVIIQRYEKVSGQQINLSDKLAISFSSHVPVDRCDVVKNALGVQWVPHAKNGLFTVKSGYHVAKGLGYVLRDVNCQIVSTGQSAHTDGVVDPVFAEPQAMVLGCSSNFDYCASEVHVESNLKELIVALVLGIEGKIKVHWV